MKRGSRHIGMLGATLCACGALLAGAAWSKDVPPAPVSSSPFPAGDGRDLAIRVCSGCHAPEIAAQQRLSHNEWKNLVEEMASRGSDASDEDLMRATDYLASHFPASAG